MRLIVIFTGLVALSACGNPVKPSALDREVVLAPGQTASVADAPATIRFDGVEGDSRCPADAVCVTGGDAIVKVFVDANGARATLELHTGDLQPGRHQGLTITLVSLSPYPFSSRSIKPSEYRATLKVSR